MAEQPTRRLSFLVEDAQAVDDLFRQALVRQGSPAFAGFLAFLVRFKRMSVFNALLVHVQRPGARAVATAAQWARIGRRVAADAVPVIVLRPFGPVSFLYDLADTEGKPIRGQDADPLLAFGAVPPTTWERTVSAARKCGVVVERVRHYGVGLAGTATLFHAGPDGQTYRIGEAQAHWRIKLNGRLPEPAQLATLAHELGHVYCGHVGADPEGRWPDRSRGTKTQHELEAEATAWLVCRRAGIETRSVEYLSGYLARTAGPEALKGISVFWILSAAHRIEARGEPEPTVRKVPNARQIALFPSALRR